MDKQLKKVAKGLKKEEKAIVAIEKIDKKRDKAVEAGKKAMKK